MPDIQSQTDVDRLTGQLEVAYSEGLRDLAALNSKVIAAWDGDIEAFTELLNEHTHDASALLSIADNLGSNQVDWLATEKGQEGLAEIVRQRARWGDVDPIVAYVTDSADQSCYAAEDLLIQDGKTFTWPRPGSVTAQPARGPIEEGLPYRDPELEAKSQILILRAATASVTGTPETKGPLAHARELGTTFSEPTRAMSPNPDTTRYVASSFDR